MQLRGDVMGQVNEAEAEMEGARAQAEQEKQARWAQMQALLSDKANLEATLRHQQQTALQLQVCPFAFCTCTCHVLHALQAILQPCIAAVTGIILPADFACFTAVVQLHETFCFACSCTSL